MALEKTVFDENMLVLFLKDNWNLRCHSIKKADLGTANCYYIKTTHDVYFLKEYQSEISESQIIKEAEILERLQEKKIPSTYFISTVKNEKYVRYKEHFVVLEKYIYGDTYGYSQFPKKLLPKLAVTLSNIHLALEGMNLPSGLEEEWLKGDAIPKYDKLLGFLEEHPFDPLFKQIKEDLEYKRTVLQQRQEEFRKAFIGITYRNSHGDYQGCQVICSNEDVKAVIDFAEASRLPVVWELMRSFIQTDRDSRNNCELDIYMLVKYVKAYCRFGTLNENDIKSMPYVYVYQLLRSTYGYKEYLLTESEDREDLIAFAFWRTKMCKVVLDYAHEIVEKLSNAIKC